LNFPKGTLFNRVNEVDPLTCPKCRGKMRVIAFIEDPHVVKKILRHLNLWESKRPPRPVAHAPPRIEFPTYLPVRRTQTGDDITQPSAEDYVADPVYPMETYF